MQDTTQRAGCPPLAGTPPTAGILPARIHTPPFLQAVPLSSPRGLPYLPHRFHNPHQTVREEVLELDLIRLGDPLTALLQATLARPLIKLFA